MSCFRQSAKVRSSGIRGIPQLTLDRPTRLERNHFFAKLRVVSGPARRVQTRCDYGSFLDPTYGAANSVESVKIERRDGIRLQSETAPEPEPSRSRGVVEPSRASEPPPKPSRAEADRVDFGLKLLFDCDGAEVEYVITVTIWWIFVD